MVYTRDKQFMRQTRALKLRARFLKKYFQRNLSLEISHLNICVVEHKKPGKMLILFLIAGQCSDLRNPMSY